MNKIDNKFFLAGDAQHQDNQDLLIVLVDHCEKFREMGDLKHTYKSELGKACFAHDATYSDSKDLAERTILNKILKDKAYESAVNLKYDGCHGILASMVFKFFWQENRIGSECNERASSRSTQGDIQLLHSYLGRGESCH